MSPEEHERGAEPEPWPRVSEGEVHDYSIFRVRRIAARSPRTGETQPFTLLECPDWVNVIAVTEAGELVLVRQYRHGAGANTLEIPGGMVDPGEDPAVTAARELREETGYAGGPPRLLGTVQPNPAFQTNLCHTYLIPDCRPVAAPHPDDSEDLQVLAWPPKAVFAAVRDGRIRHALVLCALAWWRGEGGA